MQRVVGTFGTSALRPMQEPTINSAGALGFERITSPSASLKTLENGGGSIAEDYLDLTPSGASVWSRISLGRELPAQVGTQELGCLLACCLDFNFLGFYGMYHIGANSLTFW